MTEVRREMKRAIYVRERDGDFGAWHEKWKNDGYILLDLNISEPDTDGQIGLAFEAQGPLKTV